MQLGSVHTLTSVNSIYESGRLATAPPPAVALLPPLCHFYHSCQPDTFSVAIPLDWRRALLALIIIRLACHPPSLKYWLLP